MISLLVFVLAIIWAIGLAINTRVINNDNSKVYVVFMIAFVVSIIWGYLIRAIAFNGDVIPFYATGMGIGSVIGFSLYKKMRKKDTK